MKKVMILFVVMMGLLTMGNGAWADEVQKNPISITLGNWMEKGTERYDYSLGYTIIKNKHLRVEYDSFDNPANYQRLWVNTKSISMINEEESKIDLTPGVIFDNRDRYYYGGFLDLDFPKLGFHICQKSYAGNKNDKHLTFISQQIVGGFSLQGYNYSENGYPPDFYAGISYANKNFYFCWSPISTTRHGAWIINTEITLKF